MNREDIIRMARDISNTPHDAHTTPDLFGENQIVKFFQVAYAAGAAGERDRIADEAKHIIKRAEERGAAAERDRIADEAKHIIKRAEERGAAAEREACAKVCDEKYEAVPKSDPYAKADGDYSELIYAGAAQDCADAIRARGET